MISQSLTIFIHTFFIQKVYRLRIEKIYLNFKLFYIKYYKQKL